MKFVLCFAALACVLALGSGSVNEPEFDLSVNRHNTVRAGETAYLTCRVNNLGNEMVVWVRKLDYSVLTVGRYAYTSDKRISPIHRPGTGDWLLEIRYSKSRDSGTYECQVSTEPKRTHEVYLNVLGARTKIIGSPDLFVKTGSTVNLQCMVNLPSALQGYAFWSHNGMMINYDNINVRVQVNTSEFSTSSTLSISNIDASDSGKYTCKPLKAKSASITVHVLDGEISAEMQHD